MILTVNIGSSSKKLALYEGEKCLATAHFERGEEGGYLTTFKYGNTEEHHPVSDKDYDDATAYALRFFTNEEIMSGNKAPEAVGLRIVAPGTYFMEHRVIDNGYVRKLEEKEKITPLHITPILTELKKIKFLLPNSILIGASDSVFHAGMPEVARRYALAEEVVSRCDIYRYGYHGLSVSSIVRKLKNMPGGLSQKTIVCHLGSGSSVTALHRGESVDTSMGFTPLEGIPMGSRVGSIDAEAVILLGRELKFSGDKLSLYLNTEAGLKGLSGNTSDLRELFRLEEGGNMEAKLALDMFTYKVRQYIGAYMATLGGLDTLVFTGTVGERNSKIRANICEHLSEMGIRIDNMENEKYEGDEDGLINGAESTVSVVVLISEENNEIAKVVLEHAQ